MSLRVSEIRFGLFVAQKFYFFPSLKDFLNIDVQILAPHVIDDKDLVL